MIKQVNKYNVVAFYEGDYPIAKTGHLRSPLTRLPPFQIEIADTDTIASIHLRKVGNDTLITQLINQVDVDTVGGRRFLTYKASADLVFPLSDEGEYQIRIATTAGRVFWSQAICMERIFQTFTAPTLTLDDCADNSGGEFDLEFSLTFPDWATIDVTMQNITTGNNFQVSNGEAFTLDETFFAAGTNAVTFMLKVYYAVANEPIRHLLTRTYSFGFTPNVDPCATTLTLSSTTPAYADEVGYLEFWNDTDFADLGILYSDGYKQRLYGVFYRNDSVPVVEETFNTTGQNKLQLEFAGVSEQENFDFYPCPLYLDAVLQAVRYHKNKRIVLLDGTAQDIETFSFESRQLDAESNIGQLQCQFDRNFISGCEENIS